MLKNIVVDNGYVDWQSKRLTFVLNIMGDAFFKNKNVLELGCYQGGISKMLTNLGANVTAVEGFSKNINKCRKNYPEINFIQFDLDQDNDDWNFDEHYDVIIHWGLLYHLRYPEKSINKCIKHCDYLFLESLVVDNEEKIFSTVPEKNIYGTDQSIHELGTRLSESMIESYLENTKFTRYDNSSLNSRYQPEYDFVTKNTNNIYRRFWIVSCNTN